MLFRRRHKITTTAAPFREGLGPSAAPAKPVPATSLSLSLPAVEVGGSEVIVAVIRNQGTAAATFEITTQIFGQSNGGPVQMQTNTGTLAPGASFTQTFTFTSSNQGTFDVTSSFLLNGLSVGVSNTSFDIFEL